LRIETVSFSFFIDKNKNFPTKEETNKNQKNPNELR
jgi:hypothetical protein